MVKPLNSTPGNVISSSTAGSAENSSTRRSRITGSPALGLGLSRYKYMALSLLTGQPFLMVRDDRRAMRNLVDRLGREIRFDVAQAEHGGTSDDGQPGHERVPGPDGVDCHEMAFLILAINIYQPRDKQLAPVKAVIFAGRHYRSNYSSKNHNQWSVSDANGQLPPLETPRLGRTG